MEHQEYPKWVNGVVVNDSEQEAALIESLTGATIPPAPTPVVEEVKPPVKATEKPLEKVAKKEPPKPVKVDKKQLKRKRDR